MRYVFGVDVGGTAIKIGCFQENGVLLSHWQIPTDLSLNGRFILLRIAEAVEEYCKENRLNKETVLAIGIGVPGAVLKDGRVLGCVNLGWGELDVRQELSRLCGLPVWVGNDATLAALGEMHYGAGGGVANGVLVTLGTGVGGGVILNGKPVTGIHGAGGEIGHMVLCPEEQETCGCGKHGCAEQYASATGIVSIAKKALKATKAESLLRNREDFECKDVFDAAQKGDTLAQAVLEEAFDYLGRLLANLCCVIDPEVILLGGGVSKAGEVLLEGAQRAFRKYAFSACRDTRMALATLGNMAGIYGAFRLALDQSK